MKFFISLFFILVCLVWEFSYAKSISDNKSTLILAIKTPVDTSLISKLIFFEPTELFRTSDSQNSPKIAQKLTLSKIRIIQRDTFVCANTEVNLVVDTSLFKSDTVLVDQFVMTFNAPFNKVVKTIPGRNYFMKVSGVWAGDSNDKLDAAWRFELFPQKENFLFAKWNNVSIRPSPDIYSLLHTYNFNLGVSNQEMQNFSFYDNPLDYQDNSGMLTFTIFEITNKSNKIKWSTGDTTFSISVKPSKSTKYSVTMTDGFESSSDSVTISVVSVDNAIFTTGTTTFCSSDFVKLKLAPNTKYQWFKNRALITAENTDTYYAKTTGEYYAIVTSSQGCIDSTRKISVIENPLPTGVLQMPSVSTICDTIPVILNVTGGATYQWYLNGSKILNSATNSIRANIPGIYKVEMISDKGCRKMALDSVFLNKLLMPTLIISNDIRCVNSLINFNNTGNVSLSGPLSYNWKFGDGTTSTLQNPQKIYGRTGDFSIDLSSKSQVCPSFDRSVSKIITIKEPTLSIRYPDLNVVSNNVVPIVTRQIGLTYSWQPINGLNNPTIFNPILKTTTPQDYKIMIKDSAGCTTIDSLRVLIFVENNIIVPKAFTPNGDGSNDYLFPNLIGIKELKTFRIYNRWGIQMYSSSIQFPGWDGNYQGKKQPMETYTWIAEGIDINGKYMIRGGNTLLMR